MVLVMGWWILVLGLLSWVMGLLIGMVEWRGGGRCGGFLTFGVAVVVGEINSFFFFFFSW